jgi:hypothetical protein
MRSIGKYCTFPAHSGKRPRAGRIPNVPFGALVAEKGRV